jgi:hypothetical protein
MNSKIKFRNIVVLTLTIFFFSSGCKKNLLEQLPRTEISEEQFWNSPEDAKVATNGVYDAARLLFRVDYMYDGLTPFTRIRNQNNSSDAITSQTTLSGSHGSFTPGGGIGSGFDNTWKLSYRVINRANYVLFKIQPLIDAEKNDLKRSQLIKTRGENYFLRALAYFRLISLWGDVPYYEGVLTGNNEAYNLVRTPITQVRDKILADLDEACNVLPLPSELSASDRGRATKAAAFSFRGKVKLFWASWKKNGWPELEGFTQDNAEADTYFTAAAVDFRTVINNFGLNLYNNGNPGEYGDNNSFTHTQLPAYWQLFQNNAEYSSEIIFSLQYAGPLLSQGDALTRGFGNRNTINGQAYYTPTNFLINRYQLISTGDFAPEVVLSTSATVNNGAINPLTYENATTIVAQRAKRDWRMKATVVWDGQRMTWIDVTGLLAPLGILELKWGNRGTGFINYDDSRTGYIYRKWVRQEPTGGRTDGPQDFYLMRLADVFLMYAEATNEVNGPTAECINMVNLIRRRGNLPPLASSKTNSEINFFKAIEQERIVELNGEGQLGFDARRWRKLEEYFNSPSGITYRSTINVRDRDAYLNSTPLDFQRSYLFRIPMDEIERNPKLKQNSPWF